MNIVEFVNRFNDVIPYKFEVSIGGSKKEDIITNKELESYANFKGKMVPFYETRFGKTEVKYIPANEISLHIDIKVECDGLILFDEEKGIGHISDNPIKKTRKDGTNHIIRLINDGGKQYGCIQLRLNSAGDIINKTCSYNNKDFTHEIFHIVSFDCGNAGEIIRREDTTYTEKDYDNNVEIVVTIFQVEGITTGIELLRRRLQTREDILFQSLTDLSKNFTSDDTYYYLARAECQNYQEVISKYHRTAFGNTIIKNDLIKFRKRKDYLESIKNDPELIPFHTTQSELDYYANDKNDLFHGFVGEYTGNTIFKNNERLTLIVRTSDTDFNYYTEIDLTGTDPFVGSSPFDEDEDRDFKYYERIKESSKQPKFKTKVVNGEECLVPQNGSVYTSEELEEFNRFKSFYLESFESLNRIKTGRIIQKNK